DSHVICQELKGKGEQDGLEPFETGRNGNHEIGLGRNGLVTLGRHRDDDPVSCFDLLDAARHLVVRRSPRGDGDDGHTRIDEGDGAVLHLAGRVPFGVDVGDLLELEGALKLKEISYIHAEGYPAGEMKHGPIALIDSRMPVVAIAPRGATYDKMTSSVEEVKARDGIVIAVATEGDEAIATKADLVIPVPPSLEWLQPILFALPLQLLAYHMGVLRGCDVDQPRNLAKSVTVE